MLRDMDLMETSIAGAVSYLREGASGTVRLGVYK
jgi:hypothetical protein